MSGNKTLSSTEQRIGSMRIQTSSQGVPIPIVYGRTRLAGNLIWYGDFTAIAITESQLTGKGGSTRMEQVRYIYTAALAMAICEGPVSAIGAVWAGKSKSTLEKLGLALFTGTGEQAAWGHLATRHPEQALPYAHTAYVASPQYLLGSGATMDNHSFEVEGKFCDPMQPDVNPRDVMIDLLTYPRYGAGLPLALIGDSSHAAQYCQAAGIGVSLALTEQRPAHEWLTDLCRIAHCEPVWSQGRLKFVSWADSRVDGHGTIFEPDVSPRYHLDDDDFLVSAATDDPVSVSRKTPADCHNQIQIEFSDRVQDYNIAIATATDQAEVERLGLRPADTLKLAGIAEAPVARRVAQQLLQRAAHVRNRYQFRLSWAYCLLEPMDVVTITDAALGLERYPVRISEIEEDEDGTLMITAMEFPAGVGTALAHAGQGNDGYIAIDNMPPGPVNSPVVFQPPLALTAPNMEIWAAVSGGPEWGGCEVWASSDGASYRRIGQIGSRARHGALTAALAAGEAWDTEHYLDVDIAASRGQLLGGTRTDAELGVTLCWVDGELLAFEQAQLTGAGRYRLAGLARGRHGTARAAHASGAAFARIDEALFRYAVPEDWLGRTVYLKFPSYNLFGKAMQSLAECTAWPVAVSGERLPAPLALSAVGGLFQIRIGWQFPAGLGGIGHTELWAAPLPDRAQAQKLADVAYPESTWTHFGLGVGTEMFYWVRLVSSIGVAGEWSTMATARTNDRASEIVDLLQGQISRSALNQALGQAIDSMGDFSRVQGLQGEDLLRALLGIDTLAGRVSSHDGSLAMIDQTLNSHTSQLEAESLARTQLGSVVGQHGAALLSELTTRATQYDVLAQAVQALATSAGGNVTAVQQIMQSIDGIKGLWGVKIEQSSDGRRYVSGVGLMSDLMGGVAHSEFGVRADRMFFASPDGAASYNAPFIVLTTPQSAGNGQVLPPGVYMDGAFITEASIDTLRIRGEAVTVPRKASTEGPIAHPAGQWIELLRVATPVGRDGAAPVMIQFSFTQTGSSGGNSDVHARLSRVPAAGGTAVEIYASSDARANNTGPMIVTGFTFDDCPAGDYLYVLESNYTGDINSPGSISKVRLFTLGVKR